MPHFGMERWCVCYDARCWPSISVRTRLISMLVRRFNYIGASQGRTATYETWETRTGPVSPTVLIRTLTANRRPAVRSIVNALFIRDGMVLLARRSPHRTTYPALWSFPGGHVEQDESLTDALIRELREEVGVVPTSFSFLTTITDPHAPEWTCPALVE